MELLESVSSREDLKWVSKSLTWEWCDLESKRRDWEAKRRHRKTSDERDGYGSDFDEDDPPSTGCFYRNLNSIIEHVDNLRILRRADAEDLAERVGFVLYRNRETSETECEMLWIHPDQRGQGYGAQFVRDLHFRVLCTGGRVRIIRAMDTTLDFWKKLSYREVEPASFFADTRMVAVLRPEEYVVDSGFINVAHKTGCLFNRATHDKNLLSELQKRHECHELLRSEGGVEFAHGGQLRYGEDTFVVRHFNLSDLLTVLQDLDHAGWACHFVYRRAEYSRPSH